MKQLAFLVISSSPSLKKIAQNFKPLILNSNRITLFSQVMTFLP